MAGDFFHDFFSLSQVYESKVKDGKQFRSKAAELLGPRAPAFITACLARDKHGMPKSDVKVEWEEKQLVNE